MSASSPAASATVVLPSGIDVRLTLAPLAHARADPSRCLVAGTLYKALSTPAGPATVGCTVAGGEARVDAWGPGAAAAVAAAPGWFGGGDDTSGFRAERHPLVARLARRFAGLRFGRFGQVFERLVPTVLGQKVTGKEAKRSYLELARELGEPAPGPVDLLLPPRPELLASAGSAFMHRLGIERRRADLLARLARRATALDRLIERPRDEAYAALRSVPGVGPWTIAHVAASAFGDPDAVPVGDYNLPDHVAWALAGERSADDDRMLELLAPFAGHRGRVVRLLMLGALPPPRRAPRLATRDRWAW